MSSQGDGAAMVDAPGDGGQTPDGHEMMGAPAATPPARGGSHQNSGDGVDIMDDDGPPSLSVLEEAPANASMKIAKKQQGKPDEIHDDEGPPLPFIADTEPPPKLEQDKVVTQTNETLDLPPVTRERQTIPFSEQPLDRANENTEETTSRDNTTYMGIGEDGVTDTLNANTSNDRAAVGLNQNEYDAIVPEAFPVVEEERNTEEIVIAGHAEPLLPWWKQTRTKVLLAAFLIIVAILAVSLGVSLSSTKTETLTRTITVLASSYPSVSLVPSFSPSSEPSLSPTLSQAPSPFPTTYLDKLESQQKVARDGNKMVTVTQSSSKQLLIVWYSLSDDGLDVVGAQPERIPSYDYTVSLEGDTTIIHFPDDCYGDGGQITFEYLIGWGWDLVEDDRCFVHQGTDSAPEPTPSGGYRLKSNWIMIDCLVMVMLPLLMCLLN